MDKTNFDPYYKRPSFEKWVKLLRIGHGGDVDGVGVRWYPWTCYKLHERYIDFSPQANDIAFSVASRRDEAEVKSVPSNFKEETELDKATERVDVTLP
jgi:hypothetical protein